MGFKNLSLDLSNKFIFKLFRVITKYLILAIGYLKNLYQHTLKKNFLVQLFFALNNFFKHFVKGYVVYKQN